MMYFYVVKFILFCLVGLLIFAGTIFMGYRACKPSTTFSTICNYLGVFAGGYLLGTWLYIFVVVAPFYIAAL